MLKPRRDIRNKAKKKPKYSQVSFTLNSQQLRKVTQALGILHKRLGADYKRAKFAKQALLSASDRLIKAQGIELDLFD